MKINDKYAKKLNISFYTTHNYIYTYIYIFITVNKFIVLSVAFCLFYLKIFKSRIKYNNIENISSNLLENSTIFI